MGDSEIVHSKLVIFPDINAPVKDHVVDKCHVDAEWKEMTWWDPGLE